MSNMFGSKEDLEKMLSWKSLIALLPLFCLIHFLLDTFIDVLLVKEQSLVTYISRYNGWAVFRRAIIFIAFYTGFIFLLLRSKSRNKQSSAKS